MEISQKDNMNERIKDNNNLGVRMKRVLIFSIAYHPYVGGAEVAIKEITDRIPDVHFDMITVRFSNEVPHFERIGNVNVHRIGVPQKGHLDNFIVKFPYTLNKIFFTLLAYFHALKLHRKHAYDMTWAMMANYAGFAALFFKITHPKIPYLLSLQEGDPFEHIRKRIGFLHPIFKQIFKRADTIQAISHYLAGFAKQNGYKGDLTVVPNGVDIDLFDALMDQEEVEHYRNLVGKKDMLAYRNEEAPQENIILVTTSRLVEKNGVDTIIGAMTLLPDNFRLVIIGDGPLMQDLKDLAEAMPDEKIAFLGHIDNQELPKYLKVSDIFIRPSRSEGFGISFPEAMAAGLPVIATPVGGIVDFLFDPIQNPNTDPTGLFCRVDDPQSIVDAVNKYVDDNNLKETIVTNAKRLVREKYDWNVIAPRMKKIIDNLVG